MKGIYTRKKLVGIDIYVDEKVICDIIRINTKTYKINYITRAGNNITRLVDMEMVVINE